MEESAAMEAKLTETLLNMAVPQDGSENPDSDEESTETILQEYKLWRKNCTYMYAFVCETALNWPSLSIQMVKSGTFINKTKDSKFAAVRNLLLTTYSSGEEEKEYLKIGSIQLPKSLTESMNMTAEELETVDSRLKISKKYEQAVEINKTRLHPKNHLINATINANGDVHVYHLDEKMSLVKDYPLLHHKKNGFGLCWDPVNHNRLLSSSEDGSVALWDYTESTSPLRVFTDHDGYVNDVRFAFEDGIFGSVGEDQRFVLRDLKNDKVLINQTFKETSFNSLTFSPFNKHLVAFGGDNSNIYIYDIRQMDTCLHVLTGHIKSITNIEWDPFHPHIIASSSLDRRIILWDLTKIGEEQTAEEVEDGVPELVMMHGGHTGGVNDFCFSPEIEWCIASCSDDNIVHIWQPKRDIVDPKDLVIDDSLVE